MPYNHISAEELNSIISTGLPADSTIIDVRTPAECSRGMIKGAKNIPVDQILGEKENLSKYKKIYLYCLSGGRSDLVAETFSAQGFHGELYSLTSGLLAWRKNGYELK